MGKVKPWKSKLLDFFSSFSLVTVTDGERVPAPGIHSIGIEDAGKQENETAMATVAAFATMKGDSIDFINSGDGSSNDNDNEVN